MMFGPGTTSAPLAEEAAFASDADADGPGRPPQSANAGTLYRRIWRWHFFAGIFVAPLLLVMAVTGAIYTFNSELSDWFYSDLLFVNDPGEALPYWQLMREAQAAAGDREIEGLFVYRDPSRSVQFIAHEIPGGEMVAGQEHRQIFVDQYSGKVLGSRVMEDEFFSQVLSLHRTLFVGETGRLVNELGVCWAIILVATGIYLWWPRGKSNVGVFKPARRRASYATLRDLHAVGGAYAAVFMLMLMVTGLFFTKVWGTGYMLASAQVGQSIGPLFQKESIEPVQREHEHSDDAPNGPAAFNQTIDSVLSRSRPGDMAMIQLSEKPNEGTKAFLFVDNDPNTLRVIDVDPRDGAIIQQRDASEFPLLARGVAIALTIHQGTWFGVPSKILTMFFSLMIVASIATGFLMWWKRRPAGQTGAPGRTSVALGNGLVALVVLLGLLLPLAGASMLLIVASEWLRSRSAARPHVT